MLIAFEFNIYFSPVNFIVSKEWIAKWYNKYYTIICKFKNDKENTRKAFNEKIIFLIDFRNFILNVLNKGSFISEVFINKFKCLK